MGLYWAFQAFPVPVAYWAGIFALLVKVLALQATERFWRKRLSYYPKTVLALVWLLCYAYCSFFYGIIVALVFLIAFGQPPVVESMTQIWILGLMPALIGFQLVELAARRIGHFRSRRPAPRQAAA